LYLGQGMTSMRPFFSVDGPSGVVCIRPELVTAICDGEPMRDEPTCRIHMTSGAAFVVYASAMTLAEYLDEDDD
jgi:hypothetical protein